MHEIYSENDKIGFHETFWKRYKQISQQEERRQLANAQPGFSISEIFNRPTDLKAIITNQSNRQIVNNYIREIAMGKYTFNGPVTTQVVGDGATIINQGQTDDLQTLVKRLEQLIEQTEELQGETKINALNHLDALSKSDSNLVLDTVNSAKDFFQYLLEAGVTGEIINQIKLLLLQLAEISSRISS